jgi:hypothetical protein
MVSESYSYVKTGTAELAFAIKSLCDQYGFDPANLVFVTDFYLHKTGIEKGKIKKRGQIPYSMALPPQMKPNNAETSTLHVSRIGQTDTNRFGNIGLKEYAITHKEKSIPYWKWTSFFGGSIFGNGITIVLRKDLASFYRAVISLRKLEFKSTRPPILPKGMLEDIYDNSIKFLCDINKKKTEYDKYHIPYKRGILFSGRPGCGKSMCCKWLRDMCIKNKLTYRIVSMEDFRDACQHNDIPNLFSLQKGRGIIFFDDMDVIVRSRNLGNTEIGNFLAILDGLVPTEGVVYVFTTNFQKELDSAFVRPGRIDLFLPFQIPDSTMRQRFVDEIFDAEIKKTIDAQELVTKTEDFSFAEMEEIRKLFCMDLINNRPISLERTMTLFQTHRKEFEDQPVMGFTTQENSYNQRYVSKFYPYADGDEGSLPGFIPYEE